MTKIELLQDYLEREIHNLYCFKKGSLERIEYAEKIKLLEEIIVLFNNGVLDNSKNVGLILDDGTEYIADVVLINDFQRVYENLNVREQLLKMRGWLIANPSKRKDKFTVVRFINTWLSYEEKDRKKILRSAQNDSGGVKVKAGVLNNFSQELPDFNRITKDIVNKQKSCVNS